MSFLLEKMYGAPLCVDLADWLEVEQRRAVREDAIAGARRELEALLKLSVEEREAVREFCNEMLARVE